MSRSAAWVLFLGLVAQAAAGPMKPVSYDQWQAELDASRGEIVVVDFWATWCDSCIKRFPKMVELDEAYVGRGVRFVSMLLEDPEEPGVVEMAQGFLDRQNADFDHYRMTENLMAAFEKLDLIGIPAVFIYDADGELAHRLTGDDPNNQFTDEDIDAALQGMLD